VGREFPREENGEEVSSSSSFFNNGGDNDDEPSAFIEAKQMARAPMLAQLEFARP
jgi:hypothetical protein